MERRLLCCGLVAGLAWAVAAFEPICLAAKDFSLATGNPSLQMWRKGEAVVPVWSLSGGQAGQSVAALTPPLPPGCRGVKIELLVVNNEADATNAFTDVWRVDVAELAPGAPLGTVSGKPALYRLAPQPWTPRGLEAEAYLAARRGSCRCA